MAPFKFGVLRSKRERRPNVLFVAVDDLNCRLGCYGDKLAKSPNIDRVAEGGVVFAKAFCQYPLCAPSRSSLLTGLRPDTTKVYDNRTDYRKTLPNAVTLPRLFRLGGYVTVRAGKVFHGRFEDPQAWDVILHVRSRKVKAKPVEQGLERPPRGVRKGGMPIRWASLPVPDEVLFEGAMASKVAEFVRRYDGERPLFLAVGFHKPHLPFVAPKRYFDLHPVDKFEPPTMPPDDWDDLPKFALTTNTPFEGMTEEERRLAVRAYYACVSYMDAQLGKVLDAMRRRGLLDDCIIVIWGDHGFHLGEHGLWRKMTLFEESARAALVMAAPDLPSRGAVCRRLVEFVDIYPTLAELCGLKPPPNLEGLSMVPLLERPSRPWKKAAFTQVRRGKVMGRSVRTEGFRYTEWGGPEVAELYDHERDPHEFTNFADSPEYADIKRRLSQLLRRGWRAALP